MVHRAPRAILDRGRRQKHSEPLKLWEAAVTEAGRLHVGRAARALGDLRVVERRDDGSLVEAIDNSESRLDRAHACGPLRASDWPAPRADEHVHRAGA